MKSLSLPACLPGLLLFAAFGLAAVLLAGCAGWEAPAAKQEPDAAPGEITDFYYTYEWTGYNAEYRRYRFYEEDGKHIFFHEARKVLNDYGPASEKHTTAKGTRELTDEEWQEFLGFLGKGKLSDPEESVSTGDSGPWMYAYTGSGESRERFAFQFSPPGELLAFEEFCRGLAETA